MSDKPDDDYITEHSKFRAEWLSTVVSLLIIGHYVTLVSLATTPYIDLSTVPQAWWFIDSGAFIAALIYVFGPAVKEAWSVINGG